jgi:hypothetical protein
MKRSTTLLKVHLLSRFKIIVLLILPLLMMLTSCNLRENSLLPPGLDPRLYVTSNSIDVYMDHLIRSENDNAYIYIKKESIADNSLWYGDIVHFRKTVGLSERDSLAFSTTTTSLTECYQIDIERAGNKIILDSLPSFATIYCDLNHSNRLDQTWNVSLRYQLKAEQNNVSTYGNGRGFFDIDGNGCIELQNPGTSKIMNLSAVSKDVEALIYTETDYLHIWLPGSYVSSAGNLSLGINDSLTTQEIDKIQDIYPGFALNTAILDLTTSNEPDTSDPVILYWRLASQQRFTQQWVQMSDARINSWLAGNDTWVISDGNLISFVGSAGKYFLLTPVAAQQTLDFPLDGTYSQVYLQDLWLDFRSQVLADTSLRIDLDPETDSIVSNYFSGSPYTLFSNYQDLDISFYQNGSILESITPASWIEFGFRNSLQASGSTRLTRVFRSQNADHIDYKTLAESYDASHYMVESGFVYFSAVKSGKYLWGDVSEDAAQQNFPCLKTEVSFQTNRGYVIWNDPANPCSSLTMEYGVSLNTTHPWLNGQPYTYNGVQTLFNLITFDWKKHRGNTLPANTFVIYKQSSPVQNIVNVSLASDDPRFVWYEAASEYAHNTFRYQYGAVNISPAFPGYIFDAGSQGPADTAQLRLYPTMTFDNFDWEYYSSVSTTPSGTPVLNIAKLTSVPDTYGILANQYSLSELTPAYSLSISGSSDFYQSQLPYIRIKEPSRPQNLLFSVYEGTSYRIYPYAQSDQDDAWHFNYSGGHVGFYLSSDAVYTPMVDNDPHLSVTTTVSGNSQDHIVSLYQAQLNVPSALIGTPVPLSSHITLTQVPDFTAPITPLNAYFLNFTTSAGVQYDPAFYSQVTALSLPYIYVPIPEYTTGQSHRLFFRSLTGVLTEFTYVQAFSTSPLNEYIMVGNCAVCLVNSPGWFYVTL